MAGDRPGRGQNGSGVNWDFLSGNSGNWPGYADGGGYLSSFEKNGGAHAACSQGRFFIVQRVAAVLDPV